MLRCCAESWSCVWAGVFCRRPVPGAFGAGAIEVEIPSKRAAPAGRAGVSPAAGAKKRVSKELERKARRGGSPARPDDLRDDSLKGLHIKVLHILRYTPVAAECLQGFNDPHGMILVYLWCEFIIKGFLCRVIQDFWPRVQRPGIGLF